MHSHLKYQAPDFREGDIVRGNSSSTAFNGDSFQIIKIFQNDFGEWLAVLNPLFPWPTKTVTLFAHKLDLVSKASRNNTTNEIEWERLMQLEPSLFSGSCPW